MRGMKLDKALIAIAYVLLTLVSSSAWAEKYEFVRLGVSNLERQEDNKNTETGLFHGDSIELKPGDVAKIIAVPFRSPIVLLLWDGTVHQIFCANSDGLSTSTNPAPSVNMITGPGTLIASSEKQYTQGDPLSGKLHIAIERAEQSGSTTLAWNGNDWEGSSNAQQANNNSSSPVPDPNGIKYDRLLGWCWFTDTPWIYSYTNGSWYYMRSSNEGIYVWNANLPNSGWMRLRG
jgi:hypothetical protein